jgi:choice-of-anchor A domain-containing protein
MATTAGDSCSVGSGHTTTCTVTGNNLNIINITDPSEFAGKTIKIRSTGTNATLVINVAGTGDSLGGAGFTVFDNGATVLFNYYEANTLQLGSSAFTASLLAPRATVTGTSGNFDGTLIADNFTGRMEFHNTNLFAGNLPASVPEPASIVLTGAGLISISLLLRKHAVSRKTDRA